VVLKIILEVNAPVGMVPGIKEAIAMDLEKYGDVRVVDVQENAPEQMRIGG